MSLATTVGVEHLPLGERPRYGSPYPLGIALAQSQVADDASGGTHVWTINVDPGFLYRLELLNLTRGEQVIRDMHVITSHRWAAVKVPGLAAGFDLNWILDGGATSGFSVYGLVSNQVGLDVMAEIRRFPMAPQLGGTPPGVSQQLMLVTNNVNTTTITNELSVVWTYWDRQALFLPGFLSSFHEAPEVPPLVPR